MRNPTYFYRSQVNKLSTLRPFQNRLTSRYRFGVCRFDLDRAAKPLSASPGQMGRWNHCGGDFAVPHIEKSGLSVFGRHSAAGCNLHILLF
jgi:hypothetical protein